MMKSTNQGGENHSQQHDTLRAPTIREVNITASLNELVY
jgi:hypothetical protein